MCKKHCTFSHQLMMNNVLVTLCTALWILNVQGQSAVSPVGEYYLRGEMEMAGGLKLDSNGAFQFSFCLLPTITDVLFDHFTMALTPEEISGALPFSGDHICHFQRATPNHPGN